MNNEAMVKYSSDNDPAELVEICRSCKFSARKTGPYSYETDAPFDLLVSASVAIIKRAQSKRRNS